MSRRQSPFAFTSEFATQNRTPDDPDCRWNKTCTRPLYRWPVPSRWWHSGQMETPEQRAERFRERAKKLRALAERTTDPEIKKQMLSMADQYEALAARDLDP
jgi:hypothetical protein